MNKQIFNKNLSKDKLDFLNTYPWNKSSIDNLDIDSMKTAIDKILKYSVPLKANIISWMLNKKKNNSLPFRPICIKGEWMIGKKSLVQTIARQLNKKLIHLDASKYANFDEVITFTNDKPNELLRLIHEAGVNNPMIVIDSLDYVLNENNKNFLICRLFKQILSYETNNKIWDQYYQAYFDLSQVMFIFTCEDDGDFLYSLNREMETFNFPRNFEGTLRKIKIHILPSLYRKFDLLQKNIYVTDGGIKNLLTETDSIADAIQWLRREFALYRAVPIFNKRINVNPLKIDSKYIYKNFHTYVNKKNEEKNDVSYLPGKVNILAINGNKGVVRTFEVNVVKGQGKVIFAGNVEQAMKESINNAIGFIRGNTQELGLEQFVFDSTDIQINIPQTFSKNDGPSAGIAIVTAILSAINGIPISKKIVMTGEISLKGDVYSVGAIYEKLYASIGAGANIAFISVKNDKEIKEMISSYRRRLRPIKIIAVNNYFQIFKELFSKSTSEQQKQTNTKDQIEDKNVGK